MKSAISEFMQYGIGQKELGELVDFSQSRGSLCYKLRDLKVLYESFLKAIDGRFVTTEGKLGLLAAKLDQSSLVRDSIVVFDGFTGFTPIQNRVIEKLLVMAREVRVTILMDADENIDRDDGEQKLFALSKKTIRSLTHLAEKNGVPRKPDILLSVTPVWRFSHNPGMAHLEQELFRYRKGAFRGEQDAVRVSEASTPREQCHIQQIQVIYCVLEMFGQIVSFINGSVHGIFTEINGNQWHSVVGLFSGFAPYHIVSMIRFNLPVTVG